MVRELSSLSYVVMGNGHARARYCPPARYLSTARLARCPDIFKRANARLPVARYKMPGAAHRQK